MNQQCKTQADCFAHLARVVKMCEWTKVNWKDCIKFNGRISSCPAEDIEQGFYLISKVTAAVAIVEHKPVFIGDTLYSKLNGFDYKMNASNYDFDNYSWNPPKPKEPEIPEGYTRHDGGECPVHPDTLVYAVFRNGLGGEQRAGNLRWTFAALTKGMLDRSYDIIAYKVIKPATVMVELTREDAKWLSVMHGSAGQACRKALEKTK